MHTRAKGGFPCGSMVKNPPANSRDTRNTGLISGWGRSTGVGNGSPFQYSCLRNSIDSRTWWAVPETAKSWTQLRTHSLEQLGVSPLPGQLLPICLTVKLGLKHKNIRDFSLKPIFQD